MCLACGFDGVAIQSDHRETLWSCPQCDSDLYARPPRSYAELEGFEEFAASSPQRHALEVPVRHRGQRVDSTEPAFRLSALAVLLASLLGAALGGASLVALVALGAL
jgi:hypothetical protein